MAKREPYQADVDAVIARRYDNGADYWATADKRIAKGSPFSTLRGSNHSVGTGRCANHSAFTGDSRPDLQYVAGRRAF